MIRNQLYDCLRIKQYEEKGMLLETYGSKLIYYGWIGDFVGSLFTRVAFKRFYIGFIFGFGYGGGLINRDLQNLIKKGCNNLSWNSKYCETEKNEKNHVADHDSNFHKSQDPKE